MQVQINTDPNIEVYDALNIHVSSVVQNTLHSLYGHITRIEIQLSDENHPLAVTAHADTRHQAIDGVVNELAHLMSAPSGDSTNTNIAEVCRHRMMKYRRRCNGR